MELTKGGVENAFEGGIIYSLRISEAWGIKRRERNINEIFLANRSLFHSDSNVAEKELFTLNRKQTNKPQQHCTSCKKNSPSPHSLKAMWSGIGYC